MSRFAHLEFSPCDALAPEVRQLTFRSPALGRRGDVTLYIPEAASDKEHVSLLLLLHGVYGSHWAWTLSGKVHLTAARMIATGQIEPIVIAMPSDGLFGDGSGYFAHNDADFEGWIVEDVPQCASEILSCLSDRSRLYIAGLSMGGFGAMRLGAKHAPKFSGISAHSAFTEAAHLAMFVDDPLTVYGNVDRPELSVLHWFSENRASLPSTRFDCGTSDSLLAINRGLHAELTALSINHTYEEFAGEHSWAYWTAHVGKTLRFISQCERGFAPSGTP